MWGHIYVGTGDSPVPAASFMAPKGQSQLIPAHFRVSFFVAAMIFAGFANGFAFLVLYRMHSLGYRVGLWRTIGRDWILYRDYWRVAPANNWSCVPIVAGVISFVLAAGLLLEAGWFR